jgi:hypothetical protein
MTGVEDDGNAGGQKTPDIPESYRYGLALAADYIILTDDGSASVAPPEVPLLAVLPGTGGLTRITDKRKVRRDRADVFSTARSCTCASTSPTSASSRKPLVIPPWWLPKTASSRPILRTG